MRTRTFAVLAALILGSTATPADDRLEYNRDVRPILADACFACHGPDSAARKADLRLDKREAAIEMHAIAPEDPASSELIRRIMSADPDEVMPPRETKKTLTDAQKQILTRWIQQGAEYQLHWSFIPPQPPELPEVKNPGWVTNPIDRFILARLESLGMSPNPPADKHTLARRVSLDLTGLPPSPDLVEAFVNDPAPDAYEKLVDTLLASEAWGEHRGRYWLDYSRYADTHGFHFDNYREMWSYRDWVIKAYNANMPYDRFTIENLAGDLLPNATLDQKIASGFNRCNVTTNEGGIIDEEYLVLYTRDRTETVAQVWMGLTANCSVCHSHKFDPISQREFYEMAAFFNNTTQGARDGNIKNTPPIIDVPLEADLPRFQELPGLIAAARAKVDQRTRDARPEFDRWLAAASPDVFEKNIPADALHLHVPLTGEGSTVKAVLNGEVRELPVGESTEWQESKFGEKSPQVSKTAIAQLDDAGDFDAEQPFSCSAWIKLPANDTSGAIVARMDEGQDYRGWDMWVEGRRVGSHVINAWNGDALKVVSKNQVPANEWTHVAITYDGTRKAAGIKVYINGQQQETNVQADSLKSTTRTKVPLKIGQRNSSSLLSGLALNDLRIYSRLLNASEVSSLGRSTQLAALLRIPADKRDDKQTQELFDWWLSSLDDAYRQATQAHAALERELADIRARGTIAHVMQEKNEPAMAFILSRGEYDKRLDQVTPDTPDIFPPFPEGLPKNRLGFAQWLVMPGQPLTARVTVNRFWQEVFGTGIVKTAGDFGVAGELPSHPELLDWLALDFENNGWDVKRLFKTLVMSSTYRQSAAVSPEKLEKDPQNRFLARGPRFRMDAEMVRDHALAVSGLLVSRIGGPSVKPYQPPGIWEAIAMNVSNTRSYDQSTGEDLYRRSLYTFVKRMAPPASLEIFNAPNREYCAVRRERTNTPLQALVTLNDEQFVEAARNLAQISIKEGGETFGARLHVLSMRLIGRDFTAAEQAIIQSSLEGLRTYYEANPDAARQVIRFGQSKADETIPAEELASWTMLANELMNLDEVLNK